MRCPRCNSDVKDGLKYCVYCGCCLDGSEPIVFDDQQPVAVPKKKKNGALIGVIVGFLVLIVIAGVVLAVVLGGKSSSSDRDRDRDTEDDREEEKKEEAEKEAEPTPSEPTGKNLSVKVQDGDGNALEAVEVSVYANGGEDEVTTATSDASGYLQLNLEPASYVLEAELYGYEDAQATMDLSGTGDDFSTTLTLNMKPAEILIRPLMAMDGSPLPNVDVRLSTSMGVEIDSANTGEEGFANLHAPYGDYHISFTCDGYHTVEKDISVQDFEVKVSQAMVPVERVAGRNSILVLLEWEGDRDLDLCMFNASSNEYVTVSSPTDAAGNFTYGDHQSKDAHYELLCIRDKTIKQVQTIYVVDTENAKLGNPSPMEDEGLKLYVFDGDRVESYKPKIDMDSPIWEAIYYYQGECHVHDNYVELSDLSNYSWVRNIK